MNHTLIFLTVCCISMAALQLPDAPAQGRIFLELSNIRSGQGKIHVAVYDREEAFTRSLTPYRKLVEQAPEQPTLLLQLNDLPYGRYAIAVYHDVNDNGDLDKNLMGIPTEPYGFSHNPRAKWSAPRFAEMVFEVQAEPTHLSVDLKRWKER